MENEIWKEVVGNSNYLVSNQGRIKSRNRSTGEFRLLKGYRNIHGYIKVSVRLDGKVRCAGLHWLVATAFLGPKPSPKHVCAHLNDIPDDNRIENLVWATPSENMQHAFKNNRVPRGLGRPQAKLSSDDIKYIRKNFKSNGAKTNTSELAKKFGVNQTTIARVVFNRSFEHEDKNYVKPFYSKRSDLAKARGGGG